MVKTTSKKNIANEEKSMSAEVEHTQNGKARHLYLMRHGKASKMKKKSKDIFRHLIKKGRKDVKKIRKLMHEQQLQPDLILCSPSVRTMETLKNLRKAFHATEIVFIDSLYLADALEMMHVLRQTSPEKYEVLVIGHNPGLQDLLPMVCQDCNDPDNVCNHDANEGFPTSALACLEINDPWQQLGDVPARLTNFIYSSDL